MAGSPVKWDELRAAAASLRTGAHPLSPFHWAVEFPEASTGYGRGFDAIVGNPPFLGGKRIASEFGNEYLSWIFSRVTRGSRNSDLVAFFFLRAFELLSNDGCFGFLATNTIGQGDTRETGLCALLARGSVITHAVKRIPWPGEAAVTVSSINVSKHGNYVNSIKLGGFTVERVSAYLMAGSYDESPKKLAANYGIAFHGMVIGSPGFTFDDVGSIKGGALALAEMDSLIREEPIATECIVPMIGGDDLNYEPNHRARRYVINFGDRTEALCRSRWPRTMSLLDRSVRPELTKVRQGSDWSATRAKTWWLHPRRARALYEKADQLESVYALSLVTTHLAIAKISARQAFSHKLCIFTVEQGYWFACLQSRVHELWARYFSSTLQDALNYSHTDCFETFPFPQGFEANSGLTLAGLNYEAFRGSKMREGGEGMTKTYNRFHDPAEQSAGIVRLRELHAEMDRAVLRAYAASATTPEDAAAWNDLADRAEPIFLDQANEDDHTYQGRLFWPSVFRDEVLARLLALNAERHAEELRLGIAPGMKGKMRDDGDEEELEIESDTV